MSSHAAFRDFLFPIESPRLTSCRGLTAADFGRAIETFPPAASLIANWRALETEPFRGITTDGNVRAGLFSLTDEKAPTTAMVRAAQALLAALSDDQRAALRYAVDAPEWRQWSNPEFLINPNGLRLEELPPPLQRLVLDVLRASLSEQGYHKARGCMHTNDFLGHLCEVPGILNEWSYNFLLFGEPTTTGPWGWSLYGHHLILNCFVIGGQMVISPTFLGAEPNFIDSGPHAGLRLFDAEESGGLSLMRSLTAEQRARATIYRQMKDPAMPPGRWTPADQRHLGGAFQDNRVIPYEGIPVSEFTSSQQQQLIAVLEAFVTYLPEGPLKVRMGHIEALLDQTWWSWIGGHGDDDPFYYRIQSPVIMAEFDHHSGVWLANEEPAKCHIHTIVRTPNGNDYGRDLLRQHYQAVHPGKQPGVE